MWDRNGSPKHLNKQKIFSWGWLERNVAAQLITSWDFGKTWYSIGKYHRVTFRVASLGNTSWEVKNSWLDPTYMLVSLIWKTGMRTFDLSQPWPARIVGKCDSRQCLFFTLLSIQCPWCSLIGTDITKQDHHTLLGVLLEVPSRLPCKQIP